MTFKMLVISANPRQGTLVPSTNHVSSNLALPQPPFNLQVGGGAEYTQLVCPEPLHAHGHAHAHAHTPAAAVSHVPYFPDSQQPQVRLDSPEVRLFLRHLRM